jgi:4-hydroxy-tetrahydrodipicolinate reductase
MGRRVGALARADARFDLAAEIDRDAASRDARKAVVTIDAIIDFSSDEGARHAADLASEHMAALLVCTTGLSRQTLHALELATTRVPVMIAPNTSLGIAVCNRLIAEAARCLGARFDVDVIERHHAAKRDRPSGTARRLAGTLRVRGEVDLPEDRIHSIRAGDIVGEHTIEFSGAGERLVVQHIAENRDLFALGALDAVSWLVGQSPGRYEIDQSLGLTR